MQSGSVGVTPLGWNFGIGKLKKTFESLNWSAILFGTIVQKYYFGCGCGMGDCNGVIRLSYGQMLFETMRYLLNHSKAQSL